MVAGALTWLKVLTRLDSRTPWLLWTAIGFATAWVCNRLVLRMHWLLRQLGSRCTNYGLRALRHFDSCSNTMAIHRFWRHALLQSTWSLVRIVSQKSYFYWYPDVSNSLAKTVLLPLSRWLETHCHLNYQSVWLSKLRTILLLGNCQCLETRVHLDASSFWHFGTYSIGQEQRLSIAFPSCRQKLWK